MRGREIEKEREIKVAEEKGSEIKTQIHVAVHNHRRKFEDNA